MEMIKIENDCAYCGLPCMGESCPNRNSPHYYCDECGDETEIYDFDGEQLCIECIKGRLKCLNP